MLGIVRLARSLVPLFVIAALVALVVGSRATIVGVQPSTTATTEPTLMDCGRGVPLVKCNPSLYSPAASLKPVAGVVATPALEPTVRTTACPVGFFSGVQWDQLGAQFGSVQCFFVSEAGSWVVFGNGLSLTSAITQAAPGGSIVAVLDCDVADTACRDPSTQHDFADFTVTYTPQPRAGKATLIAIDPGGLLEIATGTCLPTVFDIADLSWYSSDSTTISQLAAKQSVTPAYPTITPTGGSQALTMPSPPDLACAIR